MAKYIDYNKTFKIDNYYYYCSKINKNDIFIVYCVKNSEDLFQKDINNLDIVGSAVFLHCSQYIRGLTEKECKKFNISALYVHPEFRRQGVATNLYKIAYQSSLKPIKKSECTPDGNLLWSYFINHKIFPYLV